MPYLAPLPWLTVDGRGELDARLNIVNEPSLRSPPMPWGRPRWMSPPVAITLISGEARSQGNFTLTPRRLEGSARLSGAAWVTDWQSATRTHRMTSQMQLDLEVNDAQLDGSRLDIGGTRLGWQLASDARQPSLESRLVLREGRFYQTQGPPSGRFVLEGSVQQLGFLNTFLPDAHRLSLSGGGQLVAKGQFADDRLTAPCTAAKPA